MSPTALGGPAYTRASAINGGGPIGTEKGKKVNGLNGMAGVNRVFRPLDELVSVRPDLDIHSPLRKILEQGEQYAKSADTNLDFRRPDLALQEYIKASIIAVEIVPRHKDYPSVQTDRGDLHRLYQGLTKRIRAQQSKFDEVKVVIQENNARNGVTATKAKLGSNVPQRSNGVSNGHVRTQSGQSTASNGTNGSLGHPDTPPKRKPQIQPKPDALHGNAILTSASNAQTDLAARFERLRSPGSNAVVQDPRIRTQKITIPEDSKLDFQSPKSSQSNYTINRPTGPREMPSVPQSILRPKLPPLDVLSMPRAPAPIYNSPARSGDSSSTANLPSSVPRSSSYSSIGRKNSAPPISTVGPTPGPVEEKQDYFVPAHSTNGGHDSHKKTRPQVNIPDSTTILAQDLYEYLKLGSQSLRILLVDLRSREQFESGHIMSQSIICVEPITLRHGVSGDELGDTLIIAPDSEQKLYNHRHEFDLVAFYDQSSTSLDPPVQGGSESALRQFASAVYEYGYEKRLKRQPRLLVGGLDAWIDLLGHNSLQISSTGNGASASDRKASQGLARSLGRVAVSKPHRPPPPIPRRIESRVLTKEEEHQWNEVINAEQPMKSPSADENSETSDLYYARTTDDFMRRYPDVSTIQESMVSAPHKGPFDASFVEDFVSAVPRPPARPPPALPRQRSSGISERGALVYTPAHAVNGSLSQQPPRFRPGLTGFTNPSNLCYMNSTLQALSTTPFLREYILNTVFPQQGIPRKQGETSDPPQLMMRNLQNCFFYLWTGHYQEITPRTLHRYINAVHIKAMAINTNRNAAFGGTQQHDAAEFLIFLLNVMEDETNSKRNIDPAPEDTLPTLSSLEVSRFGAAQRAWDRMLRQLDSPIGNMMRGQFGYFKTCKVCSFETRQFASFFQLEVSIPAKPFRAKLMDLITAEYSEEEDVIADCDNCKSKNIDDYKNRPKTSRVLLTHLPEYLIINIKRFTYLAGSAKIMTYLEIPRDYTIDLTPLFLTGAEQATQPLRRGETGSFIYDIYAVIHHVGPDPRGGHYYTTARCLDKGGVLKKWHMYNDSSVEATTHEKVEGKLTYQIMLRRREYMAGPP